MELILSWLVIAGLLYCLYSGFPITWLRANGYTKYRIVHTTKYSPEGVYLLQESCLGLIWRKSIFDVAYWEEHECMFDGTETNKLEEIRFYKQWIETKTLNLKQERKRKKVIKVIE